MEPEQAQQRFRLLGGVGRWRDNCLSVLRHVESLLCMAYRRYGFAVGELSPFWSTKEMVRDSSLPLQQIQGVL